MASIIHPVATSEAIPDVAASDPSAPRVDDGSETSTNTATNRNVGAVVARIENMLESILVSFPGRDEMSIDFMPRRSARRGSSENRVEQIHFPGRTIQEARKFARVLLILQLAHDALVSGTILTKRHIYYQHQDLFETQRQVDDLVDNIASTLRVNRGDLNIVAASKGVLAGPLRIRLADGSSLDPTSGEQGVPIPSTRSISAVELGNIRWILVVEKDAVFRSLSSAQFWRTSASGTGVLITAKGYPDLITRSFLHYINERNPTLPIMALIDLDPDGVRILRCYRHGSERLGHEVEVCTPAMRWLGIKACHLTEIQSAGAERQMVDGDSHHNGQPSALGAGARTSVSSTSCRDPISYLTARDRTVAIGTLRKLANVHSSQTEACEMSRELQVMLTLGVKTEIEWLDECGDLCHWLDEQIAAMFMSPLRTYQ